MDTNVANVANNAANTANTGESGGTAVGTVVDPKDVNLPDFPDDDLTSLVEAINGYDYDAKLRCLYSVARRYARFLRLGVFPDDTKFLFVATLCRLIDVARAKHPDAASSTGSGPVEGYVFDAWNLPALKTDQASFFATANSASSAGLVSTVDRMNWIERMMLKNKYIV